MTSNISHQDVEALLKSTNDLLSKVNLRIRVNTLTDIDSSIFVRFLETLCDETLAGVVREPKTEEDEICNLEVIVKTISESLKISMSHIRPRDIASHNVKAIANLIGILDGLVEEPTSATATDNNNIDETEAMVSLANSLLAQALINTRIKIFSQINSSFFLNLFEALCTEKVDGIIKSQNTSKDEIHNIQVIVKMLEVVLNSSLSHINSKDVVDGNRVAVKHLLQVFSELIKELVAKESGSKESSLKGSGSGSQEPVLTTDSHEVELVKLTNHVLSKFEVETRVKTLRDINASIFVLMLDELCEEFIKEVIRSPKTTEDNLHNVQVVINTLASVLAVSMSHINPEDIVNGNTRAVRNLLDIFAEIVDGKLREKRSPTDDEGVSSNGRKDTDDALVKLANDLLNKANLGTRVKSVAKIDSCLFVMLLETLCSEILIGAIRQPQTTDDEIHNLKIVIKMLSVVLKQPLTHIDPDDIVCGSRVTTKHLLEVFYGLLEGYADRSKIEGEEVVRLANRVLSIANVNIHVKTVHDINTSLFVRLLERLCSENLTDMIHQPRTADSKFKTVELILKILEDLGKISLAHISPLEVVGGNFLAVKNLLQIFSELLEDQEMKRRPTRGGSTDDADSSHGTIKDDSSLIKLANDMLSKLHINSNITNVRDIDATVFITLFEGLCAESLPDVLRHPTSVDDQVYNIQTVIDTLSLDVLNTSLSHITGQDVVNCDRTAVANLLEVFSGLMDFILEEITDEGGSGKRRNTGRNEDDDDLDRVNPEVIDNVLRSQMLLQNNSNSANEKPSIANSSGSGVCTDRTSDLIALGNNSNNSYGSSAAYRPLADDKSIGPRSYVSQPHVASSLNRHPLPTDYDRNYKSSVSQPPLPSHYQTTSARELPASGFHRDAIRENGGFSHTYPAYHRYPSPRNDDEPRSSVRPSTMASYPSEGDFSSNVPSRLPYTYTSYEKFDAVERPPPSRSYGKDYLSTSTAKFVTVDVLTHQPSTQTSRKEVENEVTRDTESVRLIPSKSEIGRYIPDHDIGVRSSSVGIGSQQPQDSLAKAYHSEPTIGLTCQTPSLKQAERIRLDTNSPDLSKDVLRPETYDDYLMKYYGRSSRLRDMKKLPGSDDEEAEYLSDGCVNYNGTSDHSSRGSIQRDLDSYRRKLEKKSKAVRFQDYLDERSTGPTGTMRRKFKAEDRAAIRKKEHLRNVYEDELLDMEKAIGSNNFSKDKDMEFRRHVFKPPQTTRYRTKKYTVPVGVLLPRSRSSRRTAGGRGRKRSSSAGPTVGSRSSVKLPDDNFVPRLLEEFPYLHLETATANNLCRLAALQIEQMTKADKEKKRGKAEEQIEDAERRQQVLLDIMKKEMLHQQKFKEAKDRQRHNLAVKAKIRDKRLQSARVRKYYDEFQVRQRSKMLKKRTKEELVFKHLLHDGLDIQKDRIREIKKYAKEQREQRAKQQKQELESLENYYKDQFALLAESLEKERSNTNIRDKAQMRVLEQMKRELRKKMEREIREFQQRLWQDEDDIYFRELDAERIRRELSVQQKI